MPISLCSYDTGDEAVGDKKNAKRDCSVVSHEGSNQREADNAYQRVGLGDVHSLMREPNDFGFIQTLSKRLRHNVLRSSNVIDVGQIFFCHQPNFANDCNGLSYDG